MDWNKAGEQNSRAAAVDYNLFRALFSSVHKFTSPTFLVLLLAAANMDTMHMHFCIDALSVLILVYIAINLKQKIASMGEKKW